MDDSSIGVELGGGVTGVVGELFDEEFVGVAEFIFGHIGDRERLGREVLDQVLEGFVGQALAIGPRRVTEDAGEQIGIGRFQLAQRGLDRHADIFRCLTYFGPACAFGYLKTVVLGELGIRQVAIGTGQRRLVFLFPHIGDTLEKQQRENELLVIACVDQAAQQDGGAPEIAFEFLLSDSGFGIEAHCSQPPSVITLARRSSASRQRVSASLKAAMASASGGISSCKGGST